MSLISVEQALAHVLQDAPVMDGETVPLAAAAGRVLAAPLHAALTQPPFAASAMDGYACHAADLTEPTARLHLIGHSAAGHPFDGTLSAGQTVRIFTGAPVPTGADCVIMQENTATDERTPNQVQILNTQISPGFIRAKGMDFEIGATLLNTGTRLGPRELSLAAAMGHGTVSARRRPHVAILSTGDELVPPGSPPGPGQIISSNQLGIAALVTAAGGHADYLGIARDTTEDLHHHIARAANADILITIGGASVGDHDLVAPVLQKRGLKLSFWKIAMRPGKPLMFGILNAQRVIGLPGNPISSLIGTRIFGVPLIRAMLGLPPHDRKPMRARLAAPLAANGPRQHYMRATRAVDADGLIHVTPLPRQDSSLLSAFTAADCLIIHLPHAAAQETSTLIDIMDFDL